MTRVVHVLGGLDRGGAETWVIQVLHRMKERGVHIDFVVHRDGPFQYQAEAEALGSRIIVCRGVRCPPIYALNLMRVLRRCGPYQVIHSHVHHFSGLTLLIAAVAGVPVRIVQSHLDSRDVDQQAGPLRRAYTGVMKRLIWRYATVGIAVSRNAADALFPSEWRKQQKWRVMLLGIDLKPFESAVDGHELRRELGIPPGATVVGHVGRFDPQKNHSFLLRIAGEYLNRDPNTVFLLIGDGPLKDNIQAEARERGIAGRICFAGVRCDVPALMRGVMDVLLLPSLFEGLPLVVLEAQAAGLPCLLSDNIAEETDVVPLLIHRESLRSPAAVWAVRLQRLAEKCEAGKYSGPPEALGIERSVKGLMDCYSIPNVNQDLHASS